MKIHNIDATGSFTYNGVDLSNLTGSTSDSGSFSTQILNLNQVSSSLNSFTSSINTTIKSKLDSESVISGSIQVSITGTTGYSTFSSSVSSSIGSLSGSVTTTTSGLSSSIGSLSSSVATTTSDLSSSVGSLSSSVATTTGNLSSRIGSVETKTGSYATTGSNVFVGSQVITGSLYITNDMVVQGCSCLQNITASAVSIGTNTVVLNTATPAVRFAGISVQDSGSNAGVTGSIYWDGLCNRWVYSNPSGIGYSGGMLLSGPRTSTLGSESPLTCNVIAKSGGGDHLYDSNIIDDGTTVCVNATLKANGQVCGLMGTFSCVGIGTETPAYVLDTIGTPIRFARGGKNILINPNYGSSCINADIQTDTGMALTFSPGGVEKMRISCIGVVGIGTDSAVVQDGTLVVAGCVGTGQGTTCTVVQLNMWETTSANKSGLWIGSMTNENTGVIGSRTATGNIAFQTYCAGWAERMRITYNGKIGIGTPNPCSELTVIGNVKAGYATNVGLIIGLSPVGVPNNDVNSYVLWGDATSFGGNNGDLIYIPRSSTTADHRFYTANVGLATEKVRFTYDGKVGIGVTPSTILHMVGASATLTVADNTSYAAGVGGKVSLHGNYRNVGDITEGGYIKTSKSNSTNGDYGFDMIFANSCYTTGVLERMRISSGGNFGFNCTGVSSRTMVVKGTSGGPIVAEFIETAGVHAIYMYPNKNSTNSISSDYMSGGVFLPLSLSGRECTTDLVLATNGFVGIGTSTPYAKFEVLGGNQCPPSTGTQNYTMALRDPTSMVCGVGGSILFQGYKTATSAIGNFAYIAGKKENGTSGNEAGYISLGNFDSAGNVSERMRIGSVSSGGVVRIGTCAINWNTNSTVALQVAGAIRFGNPDGDYVPSYGGGISARTLASFAPGSFAIIVKGLGGSGFLYQIQGFTLAGVRFTDLVFGVNNTFSVIASQNENGPAARCYTITSENLNLCIGGSATYSSIVAHGFGAVER